MALDEDQRMFELSELTAPERAYALRLTNARLHQPVFRARVLRLWRALCVCRLHPPELLDVAHIIPDGEPAGEPIVPNGLSLCKIHHAAYDSDLIGVRPNLVVEVRPELLVESDGPMLRHGLQEMSGCPVDCSHKSPRSARPRAGRDPLREIQGRELMTNWVRRVHFLEPVATRR